MSIQINDAGYTISRHSLFEHVTLECEPGKTYALTGSSGCGKTTLLNMMGMLLRPTQGSVRVDGQDTGSWGDGRRRAFWRDRAAFIYQDYGVIPGESVLYNIILSRRSGKGSVRKLPQRLRAIIGDVGLHDLVGERVDVLSGGEKQRVGIARALWKDARYIFADEPTASLDADNRRLVTDLLFASAAHGACVVIATHDDMLSESCDETFDVEEHSTNRRRLDLEQYLNTLQHQ
jgi:putative ABC transport system ATP-binding protein